jgi:hypothetical protein
MRIGDSLMEFLRFHEVDACELHYAEDCAKTRKTLETIYELLFGDGAHDKNYSNDNLIKELKYYVECTDKYERLEL